MTITRRVMVTVGGSEAIDIALPRHVKSGR